METFEGISRTGLSRSLGLVLACLATSFIFTSVTLVFTAGASGTQANGTQVAAAQLAAPASKA